MPSTRDSWRSTARPIATSRSRSWTPIRNPPGPLDIHGDFPLKPAAKVTTRGYRVGEPDSLRHTGDERRAQADRAGLPSELLRGDTIFVYPNPENPARYVVVWPAKLLERARSRGECGLDHAAQPAAGFRGGEGGPGGVRRAFRQRVEDALTERNSLMRQSLRIAALVLLPALVAFGQIQRRRGRRTGSIPTRASRRARTTARFRASLPAAR